MNNYAAISSQTRGYERMRSGPPVQVIALASGKGGVGKTTITANLGAALARRGREVLLMDADFGLANLDLQLGVQPKFTLADYFGGDCELADTIVPVCPGLSLVPAASGSVPMANLGVQALAGLVSSFDTLEQPIDTLVIDSASGISNATLSLLQAAHEVLVVVLDDPGSITDAYALIKVLNRDYGVRRFHVLANKVRTRSHAHLVFNKLSRVTERFLDIRLNYIGGVPLDENVRKSVGYQEIAALRYPGTSASKSIRSVANQLQAMEVPNLLSGRMEFFVERINSMTSASVAL